MSTARRRDAHFQELPFPTLAGFWHQFAFKIPTFLATQNPISELMFGLWAALAAFGLSWPPLGLPLVTLWPHFGVSWPLSPGLPVAPWPPLATLASLGIVLASLQGRARQGKASQGKEPVTVAVAVTAPNSTEDKMT